MATTELPKTYDPAAVEATAYQTWLDEKCFHPDPKDPGEPYSIVIPPPNVTGALHLGHAINNTLQDILTRKARMEGKNALWVPGLDHAGIATQAVVEKQLKEKENKTRHDVGREGLVERIWQWKQQYGDRIISQLKRLGCSCDWDRQRFTLDEMCAKAVRETFFKLFKDGLIYRGKRLVNWDTHLLTSISDDELYTETVKTSMWHIKYPIVEADGSPSRGMGVSPMRADSPSDPIEGNRAAEETDTNKNSSPADPHGRDAHATYMTVATTRPETMLADTAVAVHPDDPRWNWAIGKSVRLPLTNRLVPIIGDPILVDMAFGSGVVKVTPAHDPNDYAVYARHKGTQTEIAIVNLMTPDGKVNDADASWAKYTGLTFAIARKKVVEDLIAGGFMTEADIKPHEANVSFSDRSKTAIQPYLSDQWFVKMAPLAEPALDVVRDGTIKFFPERHSQQYLSWLGEKRDWPISRQLWWGHRIPVWTKREPFEHVDPPLGVRMSADAAWGHPIVSYGEQTGPDEITYYVCVPPGYPQAEAKLEKDGFVQDPDVLDTWFSSALWPHSTLGWPEQTADLAKWYPTSVLLTGRDIITLWVARMVMAGLYNMKQIPFSHVAINPTILDGKGERMSKTKGNGVDPVDVIETHGADALRFTLTTMATETQDVRMPVKKLPDGRNTSEKFDLGRNFCNKLWNACRFALANLELTAEAQRRGENKQTDSSLRLGVSAVNSLADRWIISRFNKTVDEANKALAVYRFDQFAKSCYDFFWRDFCDWYVEAIKPAMKDPARSAQTAEVLAAVLDGTLRLMHPMIPFITETIWWQLNEVRPTRGAPGLLECSPSKRLIKAKWPNAGPIDDGAEHVFPRLQEIIGAIRNARNEHKVEPKRVVNVSISAPGAEAVAVTNDNREMIETLAICSIKMVGSDLPPIANAVRVTVNGACDVYIEDLVDANAEAARVEKKRADLTRERSAIVGRLSNEAYVAKAPAHLVEQSKGRLAEIDAELAKL